MTYVWVFESFLLRTAAFGLRTDSMAVTTCRPSGQTPSKRRAHEISPDDNAPCRQYIRVYKRTLYTIRSNGDRTNFCRAAAKVLLVFRPGGGRAGDVRKI